MVDSPEEISNGPFCYMAYCFPHGLDAESLTLLPLSNAEGWSHWFSRLSMDAIDIVQDHTYSFLPHVRRLLYPEFGTDGTIKNLIGPTNTPKTVREVRESITPDVGMRSSLYSNSTTRITWTGPVLAPESTLTIAHDTTNLRLTVRWIDALLFPDGTGVLVIALKFPVGLSTKESARLARTLKKIEYRRRLTVDMPSISTVASGMDGTSESTTWRAIVEHLLETIPTERKGLSRITHPEMTGSLGANWRLAIIGDVNDLDAAATVEPFESATELGAFALATGRLPVADSVPAKAMCERLRAQNMVELWRDWSMLYYYDNLVQAIQSDDRVYLEQQLENFEYEYLSLFILALAQRFTLDLLEGELALISDELESASDEIRAFNERLIHYMTRLHNLDVSTTPVGTPLYAMLSTGLGIEASLKAVAADTATLDSYLASQRELAQAASARRMERLLELFAVVAAPIGLVITLLQPTLAKQSAIEDLSPSEAWVVVVALTGLLVAAWSLLQYVGRLKRKG